jgi:addiction module HigA family antidote
MEKMKNIDSTGFKPRAFHPGIMLAEEMEHRGLNANLLSLKLHVPRNRLTAIIKGQRSITADTALRLERCLGIKAYLWMGLQSAYDLSVAEAKSADVINREIVPEPAVTHAA